MKLGIKLVIICFLFTSGSSSQTTWERTYGIPNRWEDCYSVISTYDHGFLFAINFLADYSSGNYLYCTWLLKTDINGFPLWSKYFYNPTFTFEFAYLDEDPNGNIIATGQTCEVSLAGDSFIMLLNSCGEKIWCKRLHFANMNYGWRVRHHISGNYILYTKHASNVGLIERNQLWKFDTLGEVLFVAQIVPEYNYPGLEEPEVNDFIPTKDNGFLLSGSAYMQDTTVPQQWWRLQHLLVKTDSLGNELWVRPDSLNLDHVGGLSAVTEYNDHFYTVGYKKDLIPRYQPYFAKIAQNGQIVLESILHPDTLYSILVGIQRSGINFFHSSQCFYSSSDQEFTGIFHTDTNGVLVNHIINYSGHPNIGTFPISVNNKLLVAGYAPYNYSNPLDVDAWAMKVNENLEYDSLYSFPFVYDSLCPFPIPTDTVDCDCDLITGYGEPVPVAERFRVEIYPNPATEKMQIRLNDLTGQENRELKKVILFDLFGRIMLEKDFMKETNVGTESLNAGIYLVVVEQSGEVLARGKLVVL
jgi:hypothetical protein